MSSKSKKTQKQDEKNSAIQMFVSLFLEGVRLQKFMKYMCETGMGQSVDPITDVVCVMITCPLQLVITEVGVAPFKGKLTHVYPYSEMDESQKLFLKEIVEKHRDSNTPPEIGPRYQKNMTESSTSTEKGTKNKIVTASIQMGGGCLMEFQTGSSAPLYLKSENVLDCLCKSVFNGTIHGDSYKKYSVCSILLQRISSATYIPKETLQIVGERMEKMELEMQQMEEQTSSSSSSGSNSSSPVKKSSKK